MIVVDTTKKKVKAKHNNVHLLVYPRGTLSLENRDNFVQPIAWLVGCAFHLILECTRFW